MIPFGQLFPLGRLRENETREHGREDGLFVGFTIFYSNITLTQISDTGQFEFFN